jgi:hypothetical protein
MITCEGSNQNVSRHYDRAGSTNGGPDWYDAHVLLSGLERKFGYRLRFEVQPITAVNGRWGFCVYVRVATGTTSFGSSGFGPAYPNGARTMAAAFYNAIYKATEELEAAECDGSCMGDS